jgi:hypothetical protein
MKGLNIIPTLERAALENDMIFVLGTKATLNLFDRVLEEDRLVLMVDANLEGHIAFARSGWEGSETFSVSTFFLKPAPLDQLIGNENGFETDGGKWNENIVPIDARLNTVIDYLRKQCDGAVLEAIDYAPVFNLFDLNMDGLAVKMTFRYDI